MDAAGAALLFVRLAVGLTVAAHGIPKLKNLAGTAGWFDSIGMQPGALHARVAGVGELLTGVFLAAGLLSPFASLGVVALMTVAGWTSHRDKGFFIIRDGWEYNFVLAVIAVTIATLGPGGASLDAALSVDDDLDGWIGGAIALAGGIVAAVTFLAAFYRPIASDI